MASSRYQKKKPENSHSEGQSMAQKSHGIFKSCDKMKNFVTKKVVKNMKKTEHKKAF